MFIRSERLFLRPAWPEDASDLHAAIADERVVRNLARVRWPYALADAEDFVGRPQDRRYPSMLITLPSARGARVIGGIGLHEDASGVDAPAHLGYWLAPEVWGRGYATEAASAVLRLARTLGHPCVGAHHFVDNPASGRVLEKLGFRTCGPVTERFSLGRAGHAPSRGYLLRFDNAGDCDDDAPPEGSSEIPMRAA
ncbi:GNAT family N-acetyltransferase [Novosphingobium sp. 9U]|uniref:GNAT family N-acetyltransferase n=1 Tax=Novosphingobium sp. 9U TaxID=2653158 RepID=UPI0012F0ECEB|nr:GNAT family N-acetyltransferase [Novosphingobium sp. 9U]VWX48618.1 50S ribosomal protein acetyltransferase [Novosphingobium sp. 9U]